MSREAVIEILEEKSRNYRTESLEHLYHQRDTQSDEAEIPVFMQASYPRELILGSTENEQGAEIAYIIGVGGDGRVGAVACTKVHSP